MMTRPTVIDAMRATYEGASGDLAARMMAALEAAQAEDGDIRGMQSAALKVVSTALGVPEFGRYVYDLRVDEHATPVTELGRLVQMRRAQNLDGQGYAAFERGEKAAALEIWAQARAHMARSRRNWLSGRPWRWPTRAMWRLPPIFCAWRWPTRRAVPTGWTCSTASKRAA